MKLAKTFTEDGHKQTTIQGIQYKPKVATTCTENGHNRLPRQALQ